MTLTDLLKKCKIIGEEEVIVSTDGVPELSIRELNNKGDIKLNSYSLRGGSHIYTPLNLDIFNDKNIHYFERTTRELFWYYKEYFGIFEGETLLCMKRRELRKKFRLI